MLTWICFWYQLQNEYFVNALYQIEYFDCSFMFPITIISVMTIITIIIIVFIIFDISMVSKWN